jgi:bifunctional DNA-binding transcriptional regulator/antitoxin component of YhaV-PrlF toxin-antitoxin module
MPRPTNNIRKLTRVGRSKSLAVVIPAHILRDLKWRERQRLIVKRMPRGILIRDAITKKRKK